jgi:hypothetical protein
VQYFETIGKLGDVQGRLVAGDADPRIPWVITPEALAPYVPGVWDPDADPVELYYLTEREPSPASFRTLGAARPTSARCWTAK